MRSMAHHRHNVAACLVLFSGSASVAGGLGSGCRRRHLRQQACMNADRPPGLNPLITQAFPPLLPSSFPSSSPPELATRICVFPLPSSSLPPPYYSHAPPREKFDARVVSACGLMCGLEGSTAVFEWTLTVPNCTYFLHISISEPPTLLRPPHRTTGVGGSRAPVVVPDPDPGSDAFPEPRHLQRDNGGARPLLLIACGCREGGREEK